jgi:choice-of-anchor C domain-containing protein
MRYRIGIKRYIVAVVASVITTVGFAAPALAAAFTNGSFENGTDPGSFTNIVAPNNTTITGWNVSSGNLDYIGTYWTASNGVRSLDLSGTTQGAIQQTFDTVAGHTYLVAFDMAGNPDGTPLVKTMTVDVGGPATPYSFDTTGMTKSSMGWQTMTYWFTAAGPSTTLTFTSTTAGSFGPALDNVVLTDVLTNKSQCMNNGWQAFTNPSFQNQGQCIAFLNGNKNVIKIKNHNTVTVNNNNNQTSTSGNANVSGNATGGSATSGGSSNSSTSTTTITISNNPTF